MQKFCRSKERNIKFFKVLFVAGDDVITADGLGAGSHETVLEVLCPSLECSEDIVVGNAAHLDDFQHLPDGLICEVSAVGVFSYQIQNRQFCVLRRGLEPCRNFLRKVLFPVKHQ